MRLRCAVYLVAFLLGCDSDGCGGDGVVRIHSFNLSEPLPSQEGGVPGLMADTRMTFNLAAETAAHGAGSAKVVFLSELILRLEPLKNPPGTTFDFLDEVHV